jgi:hypothetical protein
MTLVLEWLYDSDLHHVTAIRRDDPPWGRHVIRSYSHRLAEEVISSLIRSEEWVSRRVDGKAAYARAWKMRYGGKK